MYTWDDVRHFLAVQRHRTLAAAGRSLGVDETTVGRRLAALERELGARLFDRTADGLALTAAGEGVLQPALRMELEADALGVRAAGADLRVQGAVRVTTTEAFGAQFVTPRLALLRERHPQLQIELLTDARALDLSRREADLGVRLGQPREGHIVARRLGELAVGLYAAPVYLERRGAPRPGLAGHAVVLGGSRPLGIPEERWLAELATGAEVALRTSSTPAQRAAAAAGLGIAALPCYLAAGATDLRRVLPDKTLVREIWLAVRRDLRRVLRVRAVADWLADLVRRDADVLRGG